MSALAVSLIAFTIVFGGALLGMYVHLPEGHLREDVKDVVRLSTGHACISGSLDICNNPAKGRSISRIRKIEGLR